MTDFSRNDVQELLKLSEEIDLEKQQNRAEQFAAVSIALHKFVSVMFDELEYTGFKGVELIEKLELFLRAVTPTYSAKSFSDILSVLDKLDPRISQTKFYYGLNILRDMCTGKGRDFIEIIKGADNNIKYDQGEMVFFIVFLIENVIRSLRDLRAVKSTRELDNQQIRQLINEKYDENIIKTALSATSSVKQ